MYNINDSPDWTPCFSVDDIDLPTGYYLGFSATTGDLAGRITCLVASVLNFTSLLLSDNHDLISVKVFDIDVEYNAEQENSTADQVLTLYANH